MAAYLGETKMKMLEEFGAIKEKYGTQPASCSNVFQSVCPWDSAGMSAIFMKLMVRNTITGTFLTRALFVLKMKLIVEVKSPRGSFGHCRH